MWPVQRGDILPFFTGEGLPIFHRGGAHIFYRGSPIFHTQGVSNISKGGGVSHSLKMGDPQYGNMVNARSVRILLECILVSSKHRNRKVKKIKFN